MGGRGSSSRRSGAAGAAGAAGAGGAAAARAESYRQFSDTPLPPKSPGDTYDYGWSAPEQDAFFRANSNHDALISSMNPVERDAFRFDWTTGHFMRGQQYNGFSKMSREDQRLTRIYDKYLDQSVVSKGVEVVRLSDAQMLFGAGKKRATLAELQAMEGKTILSKGNLSCAAAKHGLAIGDPSKTIEYKIKIPGGSKGAGMYIGDGRVHAWGKRQREWMMNRDVQFQVGKTVYNKSRGVYEVELKFDGRLPHDYS